MSQVDIFSQLAESPELKGKSFTERQAFFQDIATAAYDVGLPFNRAQLQRGSDALDRLNFGLAKQMGDLPIENIPKSGQNWKLSRLWEVEAGYTKEEFDQETPEKQYQLYKSFLKPHSLAADAGVYSGDIAEALTNLQTYTEPLKAGAAAVAGFVNAAPRLALAAFQYNPNAENATAPEVAANQIAMQENLDLANKAWEEMTGESFAQFKKYQESNPDGISFVQNRLLDTAIGLATGGIYNGFGFLRGIGATASQIGKVVTASVASNNAQGMVIDYGINQFSNWASQNADMAKLSPSEQFAMHMGGMLLMVGATIPLQLRMERAIVGKPLTEQILQAKSTDAYKAKLAQTANEMQEAGEQLTAANFLERAKRDPNYSPLLREMTGQEVDMAAAIENVQTSKALADAGENIPAEQAMQLNDLVEVHPSPLTEVPVDETLRIVPRAADKPRAIERMANRVEEIDEMWATTPTPALQAEREVIASTIAREVLTNPEDMRQHSLQLAKQVEEALSKTATNAERDVVRNGIMREHAQFLKANLPDERAALLARYNREEARVVAELNDLGVQAVSHKQMRVAAQPYTGTNLLKGKQLARAKELIEEQAQIALDRVVYIEGGGHISAAGKGANRRNISSVSYDQLGIDNALRGTTKTLVPDVPKVTVTDAVESINNIQMEQVVRSFTPSEQKAAQITTDFIAADWERQLDRVLTSDEISKARELAEQSLDTRLLEAQEAPSAFMYTEDVAAFPMTKLEQMFPKAGALVRNMQFVLKQSFMNDPETLQMLEAGLLNSKSMFSVVRTAWNAVIKQGDLAFLKNNFEAVQQIDQMWDWARQQVKELNAQTPERARSNFESFLTQNKERLGLTTKNAKALAQTARRLFPDYDFTVAFGDIAQAGTFDNLLRVITLTTDPALAARSSSAPATTLMHELGHYHWAWQLSSVERMEWLQTVAKLAEAPDTLYRAFPWHYRNLSAADNASGVLGTEAAQFADWVMQPEEMYADMFVRTMRYGKLFSDPINQGMSKPQRAFLDAIQNDKSWFNKLPKELQKIAGRVMFGPSVDQIKNMPEQLRLKHLKANLYYRTPEEVQERIAEIESLLEQQYGMRELSTNIDGVAEDQALTIMRNVQAAQRMGLETGADPIGFWGLPPVEQVMRLSTEDLLPYAEMHVLKMLQGDIKSESAARHALMKMQEALSERSIASRVQAKIDDKIFNVRKYNDEYVTSSDGTTSDNGLTPLNTEAKEAAETARYQAWRGQVNELAKAQIAADNEARLKRKLPELSLQEKADIRKQVEASMGWDNPGEKATVLADSAVQQAAAKLLNQGLMMSDTTAKELWWKSYYNGLMSNGTPINRVGRRTVRATLNDRVEDLIVREERMRAAALSADLDEMTQLYNHGLAENGLMSIAPNNFFDRFNISEQLLKAAWDDSVAGSIYRDVTSGLYSKAIRYSLGAYFGLEQDETGIHFSSDKLWETLKNSPWMMYLIPGGRTAINLGLRTSGKVGTEIFNRVAPDLQQKITKTWDNFSYNTRELRGLDPELEMIRRSAQRTGSLMKSDLMTLANQIVKDESISPEIRKGLGEILERTPRGLELMTQWADEQPALLQLGDTVRNLYQRITDFLVEANVITPQEIPLLNRAFLYSNNAAKNILIQKNPELRPFKIDLLKQGNVTFKVLKGESKYIGGTVDIDAPSGGVLQQKAILRGDALDNIIETIRSEGIILGEDTRLNAYYSPIDGYVVMAPVGSNLDASYAKQYRAHLLWNDETGARGYSLEAIRSDRALKASSLRIKRPLYTDEREVVGETMDVAAKLGTFGSYTERLVAKADAFQKISAKASDPLYASWVRRGKVSDAKTINDGWKYFSTEPDKYGVQKWGALAGHSVSPDVYKMLRSFDEKNYWHDFTSARGDTGQAFFNAWNKVNMGFKAAHTIFNIPTHFVNFLSNTMQGYYTGRNPLKDLYHGYGMMQARKLEKTYRELLYSNASEQEIALAEQAMKSHSYYPMLSLARQARIGDTSLVSQELPYDELANLLKGVQSEESSGIAGNIVQLVKARSKNVYDFARNTYESEDLIYKLGGFYEDITKVMKAKGLQDVKEVNATDISQSLNNVYDAYFDYSSLPPAVALARDSGAIPFISYVYKAVPAMMRGIHQHPERLALAAGLVEAVNLGLIANDYGLDSVLAASDAIDKSSPSYINKRTFLIRNTLYTGTKTEQDASESNRSVSSMLNIGKFLPGTSLFESTMPGVVDSGRKMWEAPLATLFSNPALNIAFSALAKQDPGLGRTLTDYKGDLDYNKLAKHVINTFMPNTPVLPTSLGYDSLQQGLVNSGMRPATEEYTGVGIARPLSTELPNALLGLRTYRVDFETEASRGIESSIQEIRKAEADASRSFRKPGLPASASDDIIKRLEERRKEPLEQIQRRQKGLETLQRIKAGLPQ